MPTTTGDAYLKSLTKGSADSLIGQIRPTACFHVAPELKINSFYSFKWLKTNQKKNNTL